MVRVRISQEEVDMLEGPTAPHAEGIMHPLEQWMWKTATGTVQAHTTVSVHAVHHLPGWYLHHVHSLPSSSAIHGTMSSRSITGPGGGTYS
jgi:hypothetical protein